MEFKNVICETSEQFHEEVEKWQKKGAAPIIRGRKLIAYGETVAELVTRGTHGGYREGSGRKQNDRNVMLGVRISQEAMNKLEAATNNKAEFIDNILRNL